MSSSNSLSIEPVDEDRVMKMQSLSNYEKWQAWYEDDAALAHSGGINIFFPMMIGMVSGVNDFVNDFAVKMWVSRQHVTMLFQLMDVCVTM